MNGSEYVCDPFEVVGHYREADFRIMKLLLTSGGISNRSIHNNRPSYIAGELAEWIGAQGMSHARGAPFHPQTQGKIERWHQTLKNRGCWRTTSYPTTSNARSRRSSITTATGPRSTRTGMADSQHNWDELGSAGP